MRKIGGIKMKMQTHWIRTGIGTGRYCSIHQSIQESLKEVKLHQAGKIQLDTWEEYLKKKRQK